MPETLLISAGGTGGGVYPAVAVVEALHRVAPDCQLYFMGSVGGMERSLVPRDLVAGYDEVQSGPLNGVNVRRVAISLIKITVGTIQAWQIIARIRPRALFLTGGWATFPAALAAWLRRVPMIIFLPDIEPALAIKVLSQLARLVMATTAESASYFPHTVKVVETGYPLRNAVLKATRPDAISRFMLDPVRKTLLVFGGSRGSRSINTALAAMLPNLLTDGLQIIHISGELDWPNVQARHHALSQADQARYHVFPYLHSEDMGLALAAADLVVSRAGASVLGEFPHFGLPSILVPYPFAWRYQKTNADWLEARGAAIRMDDETLAANLLPTIRTVLDDSTRLDAMRKASAVLARPDAADAIARTILAGAPS